MKINNATSETAKARGRWGLSILLSAGFVLFICAALAGLFSGGDGAEDNQCVAAAQDQPEVQMHFEELVQAITSIRQDTVLSQPQPPETYTPDGLYCGCVRGRGTMIWGSDQGFEAVAVSFNQALIQEDWSPIRTEPAYASYENAHDTARLVIVPTDDMLSNLSRFVPEPVDIQPDETWEQFQTLYIVSIVYAEPSLSACYE